MKILVMQFPPISRHSSLFGPNILLSTLHHLQSHLKFVRKSLKSHFLLFIATCFKLAGSSSGSRLLIEITALYGLARQYIYMLLLHIILFENVPAHFPHAISMLRRSRCVSLCVLFLARARITCILRTKQRKIRNNKA
jgi:hypothetical protein